MKADRKRLKVEKADLVSQMQQLYTTLESREDQLREFIRNYDQHRKVTRSQPTGQYHLIADMSLFVLANREQRHRETKRCRRVLSSEDI